MSFETTRRGFGVFSAAAVAAALAPRLVHAQAPPEVLADYMAKVAVFGFSGQVYAARGGTVLLDQSYGYADRRRRRAMSPDTPIGVASISKQFTAAAIMLLAERGQLALDQPIGRYLPHAPADKAALTTHQLLTHTAGMPPGDIVDDFVAVSKADVIARALAAPLVGAPGTWRYSNAGYNLGAAVIEAASGETYEDFLADQILAPTRMTSSGLAFHSSLAGKRPAQSYRAWLPQGSPESWERPNLRSWGGGDVFSTARDLLRWQQALESGRLLSPASVARMNEALAHPGGDEAVGYGYGAFITRGDRGLFIERSGDWERGYNAAWHRWPEQDVTLIITSNSVTPLDMSMRQSVQAELEQQIFAETLRRPPPASRPLTRAERRALHGDYAVPEGGAIRFYDDGAYLWALARGQRSVELMAPNLRDEMRVGFRSATEKTEHLFSTISREAYAAALPGQTDDLIDEYWSEWTALVAEHGALQSYEVLGSAWQGRSARTLARLRFARGERTMVLLWAEMGAGRLSGTAVGDFPPAPFATVVARAEGSEDLLLYDPMSGIRAAATPGRGTLRLGEVTLRREG